MRILRNMKTESFVIEAIELQDGETLEQFICVLHEAITNWYRAQHPDANVYSWCQGILDGFVIVQVSVHSDSWYESYLERLSFVRDGKGFVLGDPQRVKVEMNVSYEPIQYSHESVENPTSEQRKDLP